MPRIEGFAELFDFLIGNIALLFGQNYEIGCLLGVDGGGPVLELLDFLEGGGLRFVEL